MNPMMRLFDTPRGEVVAFDPGPVVSMYSCGITPYDAAHVGHAQVYLTFDILQRRLIDLGHEPRLVRNVTDVDDDILRKARELGVHYLDLAAEEMARFDANMAALGLLPVYREPRATSAIPDILSLIGAVLDGGHAYSAGGAVYFDISSFPGFGQVSHLSRAEMLVLAAERGGHPEDPNKRDPLDFVLWQPSAPDEPSWESRWGPGRPGWHIECSALAMRELGEHRGPPRRGPRPRLPPPRVRDRPVGVGHRDHVLPPLAARGDGAGSTGPRCRSPLGNLVFVADLLKDWDPMALRLALLAHHYRTDWDWRQPISKRGAERLERWRAVGDRAHNVSATGQPPCSTRCAPSSTTTSSV